MQLKDDIEGDWKVMSVRLIARSRSSRERAIRRRVQNEFQKPNERKKSAKEKKMENATLRVDQVKNGFILLPNGASRYHD